MSAEKEHVNVIMIGHVDHGKSTIVGRMFYDLDLIKAIPTEAEAGGMRFAWLVDKLKEERERGLTIDLFHTKIETAHKMITIIDAPGHRDFVKNMITGASQADGAILVVSAKRGEGVQAQTMEHVYLARTLGITQLVVAINKMDEATVNYGKERYDEVVDATKDLLRRVGYDPGKLLFIPCSGLEGDNVATKSEKMPWYDGPTLFDLFDKFEAPPKPVDKPLRIPLQDVYTITGIGVVAVGRVETGVLRPDTRVAVEPINKVCEVKTLEMHHDRLDQAVPGDNIGINLKGIERRELKRGDVLGDEKNPPTVAGEFRAQIVILQHPTALAAGYTPVLHAHTGHFAARMEEIEKKIDPASGETIEEHPDFIKRGDAAIVRFNPLRPIVLEKYSEFPPLGRFAIRDMGITVGAGVVLDVTPAKRAE